MNEQKCVIGMDFGTDSVRTVVIDASNGEEISSAVAHYPRWTKGAYCDPARNQFRQHPSDQVETLEKTVKDALAQAPPGTADRVKGISVDTTGSTPGPVDRNGTPLALTPGFEENPNAMFVIWKDHTAVGEAEEINRLAKTWGGTDFTMYEGGIYSSEWFWSKILHILRTDEKVRGAAYSWIEHCDWIPGFLTGNTDPLTVKRSRCAAGHKAMWHDSFDGLPSEEFLLKLDPLLAGLRDRLYRETHTCDSPAGNLSPEWAARLGLSEDVVVVVGAFDAHIGAIGGEIKPYYLTKIMGTSTCDVIVAPMNEMQETFVKGICGQVDGSVIPGMLGMEAGQSAFGDVYAWFRDLVMWPIRNVIGTSDLLDTETRGKIIQEVEEKVVAALSEAAAEVPIEESGLLALDWMNGRRTPDANQLLKGAITGISLGSDAPRIFRALVEATAFGARLIADRFKAEGVRIDGVIALGGVPKKSPFVMQVVADVMNAKISVPTSEQTCALGAAICAATVAGIYPSIQEATRAMGSGFDTEYVPDPDSAQKYEALYRRYKELGQFIENEIMSGRISE
ncbi:MAG: ribulokinase [Bacteroidota bacterium]